MRSGAGREGSLRPPPGGRCSKPLPANRTVCHHHAVTQPSQPGWFPDPAGAPHLRWWDGHQWTATVAPMGNPSWPAKKKHGVRNTLLGLGAIVLLLIFIGIFGGGDDSGPSSSTTAGTSSAESEADRQARLDPASYQELSERDYALLVKEPDSHVGRRIVVYGRVTQFDAATGTTTFRADTDSVPQEQWYDYDVNTVVNLADESLGKQIVEDDLVKMFVEVKGSERYGTQIGGNTTTPLVLANIIEVTGSAS